MRISVVIPSLNQAPYLRDAVKSVLDNGYEDVECVVVDGVSKDGSLGILEELKSEFGKAFVYLHEEDSGPSDAYNKGVGLASGDVIVCIGADDTIADGAIAYVAREFEQDPKLSIIYGECEVVDIEGSPIGRYAVKDFSLSVQINEGCCVQFPSCYYRKEVLDHVGLMDLDDVYADLDWIARAAALYSFRRVDRILSVFRFHEGGLTGSTWNSELPKALYRLNRKYGGKRFSTVSKRYLIHRLRSIPWYAAWLDSRIQKMDWSQSSVDGDYYVFGAALTGFACLRSVEATERKVVGFIDNFPPLSGEYCGKPVLKPEAFVSGAAEAVAGVIIATGGYPFLMARQLRKLGWSGHVYCYTNP